MRKTRKIGNPHMGSGKARRRPHFQKKRTNQPPLVRRNNSKAWELVLKNIRLISIAAKKHELYSRSPRCEREDVDSILLFSLFYASQRYDCSKASFSTYFLSDARRCIKDVFKLSGEVSLTQSQQRKIFGVIKAMKDNNAGFEDAMEKMGLSERSKHTLRLLLPVFIHAEDSPDSGPLLYANSPHKDSRQLGVSAIINAFSPPVQEKSLTSNDLLSVITRAIYSLPPSHRELLEMRFGLNGYEEHTLQEIGDKFSLSRERIRQIQQDAFNQIRESEYAEPLKDLLEEMG
ncbi:sigma-70 family RNA polymerase sigma factor [Candidatus Micrarchaeota archaeon]|nr:sigma-70 family RNA polymerase sigma factor [Candidatus Micrarchaeota archaeon]